MYRSRRRVMIPTCCASKHLAQLVTSSESRERPPPPLRLPESWHSSSRKQDRVRASQITSFIVWRTQRRSPVATLRRQPALPASTCVFNDVTAGNNAVPGETGYGTASAKYQRTVGYDLATGLGSVNVANLVNSWNSVAFRPTTTTLTLAPLTTTHGNPANVTVTVAPNSGTGTATGDVSLVAAPPAAVEGIAFLTLGSGGTATGASDGLPGGTYQVHAHYSGDTTFAASDSDPVTVTVSPEGSTTSLSVLGFDNVGNVIPFISQAYGNPAYFRADVSGASGNGVATGPVQFLDNGVNFIGSALNSEGTAATAQGIFTLAVGNHAIVANYGGDPGFNSSSSTPVSITVTQAPSTTTVTSSKSTAVAGDVVALTATVNTSSGGLKPGGTVTFLSGGSSHHQSI